MVQYVLTLWWVSRLWWVLILWYLRKSVLNGMYGIASVMGMGGNAIGYEEIFSEKRKKLFAKFFRGKKRSEKF
jgi:hypothetical protein